MSDAVKALVDSGLWRVAIPPGVMSDTFAGVGAVVDVGLRSLQG